MTLTRVKLERFTAFRKLDLPLSPGINVFIGANATGKTHLLKVLYAACDVTRTGDSLPDKLVRVFLPNGRRLGRLVSRKKGSTECTLEVQGRGNRFRVRFSNHAKTSLDARVTGAAGPGADGWMDSPVECTYIPVKEMLANAPGFRSLYAARETHFEEVYSDVIDRAFLPPLKGPPAAEREKLLKMAGKHVRGEIVTKEEEFFLRTPQGLIEFTLLAEGLRKLALLVRLIQNGTLSRGAVLFWDEPETNLNPSVMGSVVEVLLELQKAGVQVFLATHNYVLLKEFDLRRKKSGKLEFHALYRDDGSGDIKCESTTEYLKIRPNAVADTFSDLYDRDIKRALAGPKA